MTNLQKNIDNSFSVKVKFINACGKLQRGEFDKREFESLFNELIADDIIKNLEQSKYIEECGDNYKILNAKEVEKVLIKNIDATEDIWLAIRKNIEYITENYLLFDKAFINKLKNSGFSIIQNYSEDMTLTEREEYFFNFKNEGRGNAITLLALERINEILSDCCLDLRMDYQRQNMFYQRNTRQNLKNEYDRIWEYFYRYKKVLCLNIQDVVKNYQSKQTLEKLLNFGMHLDIDYILNEEPEKLLTLPINLWLDIFHFSGETQIEICDKYDEQFSCYKYAYDLLRKELKRGVFRLPTFYMAFNHTHNKNCKDIKYFFEILDNLEQKGCIVKTHIGFDIFNKENLLKELENLHFDLL